MNEADTLREEDRLPAPLRDAVDAVCAEPIPDGAVQSAVTRALELATPSTRLAEPSPSRRAWLVAALTAAAATVAAIFWSQATNSVLADVAEAVAKKPWMRATGKGPGGVDVEMWYSPKHGVYAIRQGKQKQGKQKRTETIFANVREGTIDVYSDEEPREALLSRLPMEPEQKKLFASQERTFEALFFGNPLKAFQDERHKLVSHSQKAVQDGDNRFVEHRFTTQASGDERQMVTVLRVDAQSKLPVFWEATVGKTRVFSCQVDFPARGPRTIYAMGVPRDLEVVDQTPSKDLQQILAEWETGRTQFDSYRAVVVKSRSSGHRGSGYEVCQVWRNGQRWRVEQLRMPPRLGPGPFEDEVPHHADPTTWWLGRGEQWEAIPQTVCDGKLEVRLQPIYPEPRRPDPNNPRYGLIKSLEPHRTRAFQMSAADQRPDDFQLMPEFRAYPFLFGRGSWGYQTNVDSHPAGGPQGTLLIESLKRNPSSLAGRIRGARYWADPARSYAVQQLQWLKTGDGADSTQGRVEMREFAQSPNGFWYPGVVREVQNSVSLDDGARSDTYIRFYVDFEAAIPDKLFDVHHWGPIK